MAKRNRKDKFNNTKATWDPAENKSQLSLDPGSAEYQEYIEDQRANSPDRPDDEAHVKMEEFNVRVREHQAQKTLGVRDETTDERKFRGQQARRDMAKQIQKEAVGAAAAATAAAALTPGTEDDKKAAELRKRARNIRLDREPVERQIYNDGVTTPEGMDDAWGKDLDDLMPH